MSVWTLLVLSIALLVGPWVLMPRRRSDAEIRGLLQLLWRINALVCAFWYRLEAQRMAPLPEHGGAILIANHTCPIDSMLLQAASRRVLGFLIAKEYFDYWAFRWICRLLKCIPVRRDGHDLAATRAALRLGAGAGRTDVPRGKNPGDLGARTGRAAAGRGVHRPACASAGHPCLCLGHA